MSSSAQNRIAWLCHPQRAGDANREVLSPGQLEAIRRTEK